MATGPKQSSQGCSPASPPRGQVCGSNLTVSSRAPRASPASSQPLCPSESPGDFSGAGLRPTPTRTIGRVPPSAPAALQSRWKLCLSLQEGGQTAHLPSSTPLHLWLPPHPPVQTKTFWGKHCPGLLSWLLVGHPAVPWPGPGLGSWPASPDGKSPCFP